MRTHFMALLLLGAFVSEALCDDDSFKTITDAARSKILRTITPDQLTDVTFDTPWSVQTERLSGGRQQGVELLTIDNGRLRIVLVPTRGMSILRVGCKSKLNGKHDFWLGWDSPVKEVVHPHFVNLESRNGLGWLEGFNEWMVRCGLEFAGHPGVDKFVSNTGDEQEMMLTLHGKVGNIPASNVSVGYDKDSGEIVVQGIVYEKMFYGPKLKLVTEVRTKPGSSEFTLRDILHNEGDSDQEIQLIYHTNFGHQVLTRHGESPEFGKSILAENARLRVAAKSVTPMNEHAVAGIDAWETYDGPTPNFIENVYLIEPKSDEQSGNTKVVLHGPGKTPSAAVSMEWSLKQLPYLTVWKNTTSVNDGYVTGIEPGTCFPFNRGVERKAGRVMKVSPKAPRTFEITYGIHLGADRVRKVIGEVVSLQGDRQPVLNRKPPEID